MKSHKFHKRRFRIGVFDSGVGGESVANAIQLARPKDEIIYREDKRNVPYGNKPLEDIYKFCLPIITKLQAEGCDVIVIACNTVTTNLITRLRQDISVPLVGLEPMVKPAALASKSKVIAVCATPRTLCSDRYANLKNTYAQGVKVLEPDCSDWATMIENNQLNKQTISSRIEEVLGQGADQIVLGCTHYHWIEQQIQTIAGKRAAVIQPEPAIIKQLNRVLQQLE